ncbi:hypothetical protein D3C78_1634520 [compost metagenome]
MIITRPTELEINQIFELFMECKEDLLSQGIKQWDELYPNKGVIEEDIRKMSLFTARIDNEIAGVVTYDGDDPEEYGSITWKDTIGKLQ